MLHTPVSFAQQNLRGMWVDNVTYTVPWAHQNICFSPWYVSRTCYLHCSFSHNRTSVFVPGVWVKHVTYTCLSGTTEPSFFILKCGWKMLHTLFPFVQQNLRVSPWSVCRQCYLHCSFWQNRTFAFHPGVWVESVTYTCLFGNTEPSFSPWSVGKQMWHTLVPFAPQNIRFSPWSVGRTCYLHCSCWHSQLSQLGQRS